MIAHLLDWMLRRKLHPTSLPEQLGDEARVTTEGVLASFSAGVKASVERLTPDAVVELEKDVEWHRRCFFWEGYAFGLAARHALGFRRGNPDRGRIIPNYRAMHYTGYGFWNGVADSYHLPKVSEKPERWRGVSDFDRLNPMIAGGVGFAFTGLGGAWHDDVVRRLERAGSAPWAEAAIHGCGRALWFLYMHNVERLEAILNQQRRFADVLCEGLGIAIAFTYVADPAVIERTVGSFAANRQASLLRGAGICLYELTREDPSVTARILAIRIPALRTAFERSAWAAYTAAPGSGWYWRYAKLLRDVETTAASNRGGIIRVSEAPGELHDTRPA